MQTARAGIAGVGIGGDWPSEREGGREGGRERPEKLHT